MKRARKKPKGLPLILGIKTIKISDGSPTQGTVHLRRRAPSGPGDKVVWLNLDDRGRTVIFNYTTWPFLEPPQEIKVPAGGYSRVFTVYARQPLGKCTYEILPPAEDTPPGGPIIDVDP